MKTSSPKFIVPRFSDAISGHVSDLGWVFEYRDHSPEHVVRVGPMRVEQLLEQVFGSRKRDLFPEQFLYVDMDRIHRGDGIIPADEAVTRAEALLGWARTLTGCWDVLRESACLPITCCCGSSERKYVRFCDFIDANSSHGSSESCGRLASPVEMSCLPSRTVRDVCAI